MKKNVLSFENKDFYDELQKIGIAETRIPELIVGFRTLYDSLVQMDEENLGRVQRVGLNRLFLKYIECHKELRKIQL